MSSSNGSPVLSPPNIRSRLRATVEDLGNDCVADCGDDLDLVYRAVLLAVFRVLTFVLARETQRLFALPPAVNDWNSWRQSFREAESHLSYPSLFSRAGFPEEHALLERIEPRTVTIRRLATTCAALAGDMESPHDILSGAYQALLRFKPDQDPTSRRFRLVVERENRKARGVFYTPRPLARVLVGEIMSATLPPPSSVFDPAVGSGVFLLEAARWLSCRGRRPADAAESCLFGVDRDSLAIELAILSLWLETGARPSRLASHLSHADSLAGGGPRGPFDAVVCNPPWGVKVGGTDSFKLFLDLATARSSGTVGVIVPQAMLGQTTHTDVRQSLLEGLDPYQALLLGDRRFGGAAAPACALVFGPKPGPTRVRVADCRGQALDGPIEWREISRDRWTTERFPLAGCDTLDLLARLKQRHSRVGTLSHVFRVRDSGINYSHASVARRSLYEGTKPDDPRDIPRFRGRDFTRYSAVRQGGWLRHSAKMTLTPGERLTFARTAWQASEKIVIRQTADRIVATLDRSRMAMGRSVIAITGEGSVSLPALLACLNSRLLTVLYRSLAGETGRIMAQVKVARLHDLPVPLVCSTSVPSIPRTLPNREDRGEDSDATMIWIRLHHLVLDVLEAGGSSPESDTLIDGLVYKLYGLTEGEIALVDSA